jgi:hypothetical protein
MAGRDVLRRLVAAALAGALVLPGSTVVAGRRHPRAGCVVGARCDIAAGVLRRRLVRRLAPAYLARGRLLVGGVGAARDLHGKALSTLPAAVVLARSTVPGGRATTLVGPTAPPATPPHPLGHPLGAVLTPLTCATRPTARPRASSSRGRLTTGEAEPDGDPPCPDQLHLVPPDQEARPAHARGPYAPLPPSRSSRPALAVALTSSPRLGLDLRGGTQIVLETRDAPTVKADAESTQRALEVLRRRVDALGVAEPTIARAGDRRIIVELPGCRTPRRRRRSSAEPRS